MLLPIPDVLTAEQVFAARQRSGSSRLGGRPRDGRASIGARQGQHATCRKDRRRRASWARWFLPRWSRTRCSSRRRFRRRVFPPLFNRYQGGQSFGTHVDNAIRQVTGHAAPHPHGSFGDAVPGRSPDEYDGGELVVEDTYGTHSVKLPAGHMILYPATSLHHVRPVTRGARLASFFWIQSMVRDDGERTLLFDLDVAIQRLNGEGGGHPVAVQLTGVYHNLLRQWAEV